MHSLKSFVANTPRCVFVLVLAACTAPSLEGAPIGGGSGANNNNGKAGASSGGFPVDLDGGLSDEGGVPLDGQNPNGGGGGPDVDSDGVPDQFDCDPQSSKVGARIVEDDLGSAKGLIAAAPGFDPKAWTHEGGGYRQGLLRDSGDVSLFTMPPSTGSFSVEVTALSVAVGSFYPRLRQDFVVLGATSENGSFSGLGCGVEVVEGGNPEMKASLVSLSGSATAIVTNPIKRADRQPLPVNEPFNISVRVEGGNVTCTVTQSKGTTTVAAPNVGELRGAVGFYTRQTSAQFSKVRICQLR